MIRSVKYYLFDTEWDFTETCVKRFILNDRGFFIQYSINEVFTRFVTSLADEEDGTQDDRENIFLTITPSSFVTGGNKLHMRWIYGINIS